MTVVARTSRPCGPFPMLAPFCRTDEASVPRVTFAKLRQLLMRRSLEWAGADVHRIVLVIAETPADPMETPCVP